MMHNYGTRRGSVLAEGKWLAVLSTLRDQPYKHTIWQYAVQIPTLMEYLDVLRDKEDILEIARLKALANLRTQAILLDIALDDWTMSYEGDDHIYWQTSHLDLQNDTLGRSFDFATLAAAEVMMLSWAFKLELAIIVLEVTRSLAVSISCEARLLPDKILAVKELASMICRSASYWINAQASAPAIYSCFSFPHRIAWKWYASEASCDVEVRACARASQCMRKSRLLGRVAEHLVDLLYGTVDAGKLVPQLDDVLTSQ
jgi:hypothetical protein